MLAQQTNLGLHHTLLYRLWDYYASFAYRILIYKFYFADFILYPVISLKSPALFQIFQFIFQIRIQNLLNGVVFPEPETPVITDKARNGFGHLQF